MPSVDVLDEIFLAVPPATVAAVFADSVAWRRFWPDLRLEVYADRGVEGLRWTVDGALVGTQEVWLEPVLDGTLLHYFLRADPPPGGSVRPGEAQRRQLAAKRVGFAVKARLEAGRAPGCPPPAAD
ncbi:polyketide cyclase / dehydrase and lipid transport [Allokutzneria sp. NRRL B-24872]|uniref:polyketide cyclase / dehydrase and lipid transport n=1 Tax=Allokutzneria sp. NRRL B-24872 TaxID=1137961 RepID=UPI000A3B6A9B|nr:polyketide cyclase / dehydrase and lipid transport [Allokutzneria sp. NRRL B-24872]